MKTFLNIVYLCCFIVFSTSIKQLQAYWKDEWLQKLNQPNSSFVFVKGSQFDKQMLNQPENLDDLLRAEIKSHLNLINVFKSYRHRKYTKLFEIFSHSEQNDKKKEPLRVYYYKRPEKQAPLILMHTGLFSTVQKNFFIIEQLFKQGFSLLVIENFYPNIHIVPKEILSNPEEEGPFLGNLILQNEEIKKILNSASSNIHFLGISHGARLVLPLVSTLIQNNLTLQSGILISPPLNLAYSIQTLDQIVQGSVLNQSPDMLLTAQYWKQKGEDINERLIKERILTKQDDFKGWHHLFQLINPDRRGFFLQLPQKQKTYPVGIVLSGNDFFNEPSETLRFLENHGNKTLIVKNGGHSNYIFTTEFIETLNCFFKEHL
jgi:hypothetical protein